MDGDAIMKAVMGVTEKWARQRKAEERHRGAVLRRRDALVRSCRVTDKEAAWECMPDAYLEASTQGRYPAFSRQVMYRARGPVQELTGRTLSDKYFCKTLLPAYLEAHPRETASWDVVFDARGHLVEPHTELSVPLGTLDVRQYLKDVAGHVVDEFGVALAGHDRFPTKGPRHRFGAVLFIEKEGFWPLFKAVHLAERYDLAIMSTKGLSVTASRTLVEQVCREYDVPLLVLHDFDKAGFSTLGTFLHDTKRYRWKHRPRVIDIGLRLKDVEQYGLEWEAAALGKSDPTGNLLKNGATRKEAAFLAQGRRVELNMFSSGPFVEWVEAGLQKAGVKKVVPDAATLEGGYRRALGRELLRRRIEALTDGIREAVAGMEVPADLVETLRESLESDPGQSWDGVLRDLAGSALDEATDEEE